MDQTRSNKNEFEPIQIRHKYRMNFFMVFHFIGFVRTRIRT